MNLRIFNYENPNAFLKDAFEEKKKINPRFSLRSLAMQMGLKSHNSLYEIFRGNRNIPKSYLPKLKELFNLSDEECFYLEAIIDLDKAKSVEEKELYLDRVKKLSPNHKVQFIEVENYKFIKDPLNAAVLELVLTKSFKNDLTWIQSRLNLKVTQNEIKESIERLIVLGHLEETEDGDLERRSPRITSQNDIKNKALQEFHKNVCELAKTAVSEQDVLDREFYGYICNVSKKDIPEAKEWIRRMVQEFANKFEAESGTSDDIYCLQTNLFSITNNQENL